MSNVNIKHRLPILGVLLLIVAICSIGKVVIKKTPTPSDFTNGYNTRFFNPDGGINFYVLDTAYKADMTLLIEKKTLHSFIIVDIDKANIAADVTEQEVVKNPYCYYTVATTGRIRFSSSYWSTVPYFFTTRGDTIIDYGYIDLDNMENGCILSEKEKWDNTQFDNFSIVPFDPPADQAILCMVKAKVIKKWSGILIFISYVMKDSTQKALEDECIAPYHFDNEEAFYKMLFPYSKKKNKSNCW